LLIENEDAVEKGRFGATNGLFSKALIGMDVWKRGANPPLPRSRDGSESLITTVMGQP
jgi:hypothetical protein